MHNAQPTLVLASASPRRRELLAYLGVTYHVIATTGEEDQTTPPQDVIAALPPFPLSTFQHPSLLAWRKVDAAAKTGVGRIILGADTIVVIDTQILNKPQDNAEASSMLHTLAGRTHRVYTGIALLDQEDQRSYLLDMVCSEVSMAHLTDEEIAAYVATGEPLDKAGAYGIQGLGGRLVQRVVGSYTGVVGLPLPAIYRLLQKQGFTNLVEPDEAFRRWFADQGKDLPECTAP